MCATWLVHTCDVPCWILWNDSLFLCFHLGKTSFFRECNTRARHHVHTYVRRDSFMCVTRLVCYHTRWLRLVGSLKFQVFFAKEPYKRDYILQTRPIIWRSLLIVATPYVRHDSFLPHSLFRTAAIFCDLTWCRAHASHTIFTSKIFSVVTLFGLFNSELAFEILFCSHVV